jgi:2',3'-cyclic-nucleotide 2'-phosphodiesterase (5'-nucleotidase family)
MYHQQKPPRTRYGQFYRSLTLAMLTMASWIIPNDLLAQTNFGSDNLAVLLAASSSANNTTVSVVEIDKVTANQAAVQTIPVPGSGPNAIRVSGSATSTLYAANSANGALFCFTGHSSTNTTSNANTLLTRAVVAVNATGGLSYPTTYTGVSGQQTRCATSLNNTNFYIADQAGLYTNGSTSASPGANVRSVRSFGSDVYVGQQSSTVTNIQVSKVSAISGGTISGLPGLTNHPNFQDFYLISSGSNGSSFDVLYILRNTSATAGFIDKYSLVSGTWVSNGTSNTTFGGFGLAAQKDGTAAALFVTTGSGATGANNVRRLVDNNGYNASIDIVTNVILYTAPAGATVKGLAFAPTGPQSSSISGGGTICAGANDTLNVNISGGVAPYTVVYTDGTNLFTVNNYESNAPIYVSPTTNTTYTLVQVSDNNNVACTALNCWFGTGSAIVTVNPSTSNTTVAAACDSYTWSVDNTIYTQSGTYTNVNGCHTEILDLTITPSTSNTTVVSNCDSYTWSVNNMMYTQSGTYTNVNGCQTEILDLTITSSTSNTTVASNCDSYTWSVDNTIYTQSGTYTNVNGCHTEILDLTITPSTSNTTVASNCDSYTWSVNNMMYTQSGTYTNVNGCQTEILDLTITPIEVNLSISANAGSEAAGTIVTVTATASAPVNGIQSVSLGVSGTGITAGDYTLSNSTITIPDGQTTGSVTFTVVNDNVVEATETAVLTISNPSSCLVLGGTTTQNITISDFVFTLQVLHASDFEAGVDAVTDAPRFAAIVDTLEGTYANTIKLSSGDNYIPGPFLSSAEDPSLAAAYKAAYESYYNTTFSSSSVNLLPSIGRADISIMNFIGIEASALGNHEFDLGTTEVRNIIRGANSSATVRTWFGAQFPYLSANLNFSGDANLSAIATTNRLLLNTAFQSNPSESVSANTNRLKLAPSTIIMKGGQKIGIVGATTQVLAAISSPGATTVVGGGANDMNILAGILQPVINDLIADGCNKVILLSHLQQIAFEKDLAGKLNGVDIIMAGGSHTLMADANDRLRASDVAVETYPFMTTGLDGKSIALINTDANYKYVGRLVVDFDANGDLIPSSINPLISGVYAADAQGLNDAWGANVGNAFAVGTRGYQVQLLCTAVGNVITAKDGNLFGKTSVFLEGRRNFVRTEETNLGNVSAEANLWMAKFYDPATAISIKNAGGIRSAIGNVNAVGNNVTLEPPVANPTAGKQAGDISQLDIENSLRFNNQLSLLTLTASGLRSIIEHAVAATTASSTPGQFAQVAGVRYSYNFSLPAGSRILNAVITDAGGNNVLDTLVLNGVTYGNPARTFRVVTLNFLAGGGDSYPFNTLGTNRVDLNTVPAQGPALASFTNAGSEQDAFAEYMKSEYSTTPYGIAETPLAQDCRIQRIPTRTDNVLPPNPGTNGSLAICNGSTITESQLFAALGGTPSIGGTWSPAPAGAGVYTYLVTSPSCSGSASATVTVTSTPLTSNTTVASNCDSYTWSVNNMLYTQSGTYTNVNGCHTEILDLTITPSTSNTTVASNCASYTWSVNNMMYTQSGTYTNVNGCHTEILDLTITPSTSNTTVASNCDSYTWSVNNMMYTQSGTYTNVNGCHTEILDLTITPSTSNTTVASNCASYTWSVNNMMYTQSGTYTNVNGCHTEILDLTITPTGTNTTVINSCGSYTWSVNNMIYSQSGTFSQVNGCLTEVLVLTINPLPIVTASDISACAGQSVNLIGNPSGGIFSVANPYMGPSTTFTYTYTDANGCSATSAPANIYITSAPPVTGLNMTNIGSSTATINWNSIAGLIWYEIRYRPVGASSWIGGGTQAAPTSFKNIISLQAATAYEIEVRGFCTNNASQPGPWSTTLIFNTALACPTPTNLSAINVTSNLATLVWNAVPNANYYQIRYRTQNGPGAWVSGTASGSATSKNLNGLVPGTAYEWQIRAICNPSPFSTGSWSPLSDFTTGSQKQSIEEESSFLQNLVSLYPNPASGLLHVDIVAVESQEILIRIMDMSGRVVQTVQSHLDAGSHTISLNIDALSEGLYQVHVSANEKQVFSTKFSKIQ